jgi:hypothetical protein
MSASNDVVARPTSWDGAGVQHTRPPTILAEPGPKNAASAARLALIVILLLAVMAAGIAAASAVSRPAESFSNQVCSETCAP